MRAALLSCAWLCLAACSGVLPASAPPQLSHTPGPPVVVGAGSLDAGLFRLRFPPDWRVIKLNEASQPLRMSFVAPDGGSVDIGLVGPEAPEAGILWLESGWGLWVETQTGADAAPHFERQAQALIDSIN